MSHEKILAYIRILHTMPLNIFICNSTCVCVCFATCFFANKFIKKECLTDDLNRINCNVQCANCNLQIIFLIKVHFDFCFIFK